MELRECPFCGDNLQWDSTLDGYSHNDDSDCFFAFVCIPIENAEDWNTRHSDAAIKELFNALEGMVSVAETECWESATTGRQILLADAKAVIEKYKDAK